MRINTNVMALNAQNKLTKNQSAVEKSIQKLSSGLRINGAADDAAGLAISEKMRSQIRGLDQAQSNAQDGISLLQTAEGALQQTTDILQRMRELVIKAQNTGVLTDDDKIAINTEMSTLRDEIDRIASSTTFNSKKLLDGSLGTHLDKNTTNTTVTAVGNIDVSAALTGQTFNITSAADADDANKTIISVKWTPTGATQQEDTIVVRTGATITGSLNFTKAGIKIDTATAGNAITDIAGATKKITTQALSDTTGERAAFKIGANTYEQDTLYVGINSMSSEGLSADGSKLSIKIDDATTADQTLLGIDEAIKKVSSQRATLGAVQNRMDYAISSLSATSENLSAAESRIRDVDMASEMVSYTKNSILNQSAMSMLAQANQQPQQILALLQ